MLGDGLLFWVERAPVGWFFALFEFLRDRHQRDELMIAEAVALGSGTLSDEARRRAVWRLSGGGARPVAQLAEGRSDAAALRETGEIEIEGFE